LLSGFRAPDPPPLMPNLGEEIYSVLGVEPPDPSIWTMKQLMPRLHDTQKNLLLAD